MIYILRHGLDDEEFIGGWSKVELTEEGRGQVKKTIEFMKEHKITFDKIYSSDVLRAEQTAELVAQAYHKTIILDDRFRELDKGLLTGLSVLEAKKRYPRYMENLDIGIKYPMGESLMDLYKRQKEVLEWLLMQEQILVVTHRGPVNMYYFDLNGQAITNDKKRFGVTHASLHELDTKKKTLRKIYDPKWRRE